VSKLVLFLMCIFAPTAAALDTTHLSLEVRKMDTVGHKRHAYYPEKDDWRGYVGLNWNVESGYWYWNNRTYFYGDQSQVRHIGWEWESGFHYKGLYLFWYHHSEHTADDVSATGAKFPLEDSLGVRIELLSK